MNFLKAKVQTQTKLEITIPVSGNDANRVADALTSLASSLSVDDLELLKKGLGNPVLKNLALSKLREYVK